MIETVKPETAVRLAAFVELLPGDQFLMPASDASAVYEKVSPRKAGIVGGHASFSVKPTTVVLAVDRPEGFHAVVERLRDLIAQAGR